MVRRSWKRCIRAAYFLADSWFDGIDFIKDLREIAGGAQHVICMAKNGMRKYDDNGHKHAGKELVAMNERHAKTCRQYKCRYFKVDVTFEGVELRLFFIQYGKSNGTGSVIFSAQTSNRPCILSRLVVKRLMRSWLSSISRCLFHCKNEHGLWI